MKRLFIEDFEILVVELTYTALRQKRRLERQEKLLHQFLKCEPLEVVFTSGATESNNMAILGLENYGKKIIKTILLLAP